VALFLLSASGAAQKHTVLAHEVSLVEYPRLAQMARAAGVVEVKLRLNSDGSTDVIEVAGHSLFKHSVEKSLPKWSFVCTDCFGEAAEFELTVEFTLSTCTDDGPQWWWRNSLRKPLHLVVESSVYCPIYSFQ
jgi:hypothetical protein